MHSTLIQHILEVNHFFGQMFSQSVCLFFFSDKWQNSLTVHFFNKCRNQLWFESDLKKLHPNSSFLLGRRFLQGDPTFFLPSAVVSCRRRRRLLLRRRKPASPSESPPPAFLSASPPPASPSTSPEADVSFYVAAAGSQRLLLRRNFGIKNHGRAWEAMGEVREAEKVRSHGRVWSVWESEKPWEPVTKWEMLRKWEAMGECEVCEGVCAYKQIIKVGVIC